MQKNPSLLPGGQRHAASRLLLMLGFTLAGLLLGHWWTVQQPGAGGQGTGLWGQAALLLGCVLLLGFAVISVLLERSAAAREAQLRDPVSGLYRREHADGFLARQLAREERQGTSRLALVLIRVDHLDLLRRRYGSDVVEQALRLVGRQVRGQTRDGDLPVRHAEGMFAVYLDADEIEQAQAFGRRISMLLLSQQLDWHGDVIKVDVSLGIALRVPGEGLDTLLQRAARGFEVAVG
jgi:diguanylate cyclase (GGDEF)-like protein